MVLVLLLLLHAQAPQKKQSDTTNGSDNRPGCAKLDKQQTCKRSGLQPTTTQNTWPIFLTTPKVNQVERDRQKLYKLFLELQKPTLSVLCGIFIMLLTLLLPNALNWLWLQYNILRYNLRGYPKIASYIAHKDLQIRVLLKHRDTPDKLNYLETRLYDRYEVETKPYPFSFKWLKSKFIKIKKEPKLQIMCSAYIPTPVEMDLLERRAQYDGTTLQYEYMLVCTNDMPPNNIVTLNYIDEANYDVTLMRFAGDFCPQ